MNIPYLPASVLLLLLAIAQTAAAEPGRGRGGWGGMHGRFNGREVIRDSGRDLSRNEELLQRHQKLRQEKQFDNAAPGGAGCAARDAEGACRQPNAGRNRLTQEERRALRRQIREAGQDIYAPDK